MNLKCALEDHDWQMVYPDQDLIDAIHFKQSIEEIWVCSDCNKAKKVMGTVGTVVPH